MHAPTQLDAADPRVQAKLPALMAAIDQATVAIDLALKAKEVEAELKSVDALCKKTQDASRAMLLIAGSSLRPGYFPPPRILGIIFCFTKSRCFCANIWQNDIGYFSFGQKMQRLSKKDICFRFFSPTC